MKRVKLYVPNVILTLLLVFLLIGSEGTILARRIGLSENTFRYITEQQQLDAKGYDTLTTYFKMRSNSTGIPESVFLDAVNQEDLHAGIIQNAGAALDYICGRSDAYEPSMEFMALETAVTDFFVSYAKDNSYEQDEAFDQKVQSAISEAEAEILITADPFRFSTLHENGWLEKARQAVSYLDLAVKVCVIALIIVIVLLVLCNLKQLEHLCYWIGLAGFTSGLLTAVPCIYLTASDFFSGFTIKDPQVFAAITGLLRLLTSRGLTMAIITAIVGVICIISFAFLRAVEREEDEA